MTMDEHEINHIVAMYKKKRDREYLNYHTKYKLDEALKEKARVRAKDHYKANNEKNKQLYQDNKDFHKARSSFYYYKKNNNLNSFHEKYPERVQLLQSRGFKVEEAIELPKIVVSFD